MKRLAVCVLLLSFSSVSFAATVQLAAGAFGVPSCGTPRVETFVKGFNLDGTILGVVKSRASCSSGGRGSRPNVYFSTGLRTWGQGGATISTVSCAGLDCTYDVNFTATDINGRQIYNAQTYTSYGLLYRSFLNTPDAAAFTPIEFNEILFNEKEQE